MPRRKKASNRYWTKITEYSVSAYNRSTDNQILKEKIYRRFIYPAFLKLSENLIDNSLECDQLNLEKINPYLSNDLTSLQQAGWLSLGQILRQQGNLGTSELILNKILDQVYSQETKASILLNIGQGLQLQNDIEGAKDSYQQAIIAASNVETRLKIQLNKLNLEYLL